MVTWRHKARLRPRELAEVASVSPSTLRRAIDSGEVESYVEGGCRFIPISAALAYVGEHVDQPAPASVRVSRRARDLVAEMRRAGEMG